MAKILLLLSFVIVVSVSASEDSEVVDLQPAGTFGLGLGIGGLGGGLGGLGWGPKRIIIPKTYGWDSGYISTPALIDGGHYGHGHYPSFGYREIPIKSYGWGEQIPSYGYSNYIVDQGPGWGWDGAGGLGPY